MVSVVVASVVVTSVVVTSIVVVASVVVISVVVASVVVEIPVYLSSSNDQLVKIQFDTIFNSFVKGSNPGISFIEILMFSWPFLVDLPENSPVS